MSDCGCQHESSTNPSGPCTANGCNARKVVDPPFVCCALCGTGYEDDFKIGIDGGWARFNGRLYMLCTYCQGRASFTRTSSTVVYE